MLLYVGATKYKTDGFLYKIPIFITFSLIVGGRSHINFIIFKIILGGIYYATKYKMDQFN
jgi:hypothetical protein